MYGISEQLNIEGMFRIIESIPSKNAEPIKQWLAHLGKERGRCKEDRSYAIISEAISSKNPHSFLQK